MQTMKETASNIGASAKAGMEKTKAAVQEKVDKATARDPVDKDFATQKKEARMAEAEAMKQDVKTHNAAARQGGPVYGGNYTTGGMTDPFGHSAAGQTGQGMGAHPNYPTAGGGGMTDPFGHSAAGQTGQGMGAHQNYSTGGGLGGVTDTFSHSATGQAGQGMGAHQMSAMPGHGTGQPYGGHVDEGVARVHPSGLPGEQTGHNTRTGGTGTGNLPGYGTGGSLS